LLGTVLDPVVKLHGDIAQPLARDALGLLEGLNQTVEQQSI
jgi:hypothetical protein